MTSADVRQRAAAGIALVGARGVAVRAIGFASTVVLARLLAPEDFGLVALGGSVTALGAALSNVGFGASLIGRREPPERIELEAVLGFQLAVSIGLVLLAVMVGAQFGRPGIVVAVMSASLPLFTLRTPATIVLERRLSYRPLATVEVAQTLVYSVWAVALVVAGAGVWGLATAVVVSAGVGSAMMLRIAPFRILRPRLSWTRVRPLIGFGARFQAIGLVNAARDQGLNVGTAAIAGVSTLGVWSIAFRLLQIPILCFEALWRVTYPAMSRLLGAGEAPRPMIERGLCLAAVGTGLILTPLAGSSAALVPALFGDQWNAAASVLPWACLGLMIGGPISVASAGYLYAVGDASTALRAVTVHTLTVFAIAFAGLPIIGISALGLGLLGGAVADALILSRQVTRQTGTRVWEPLAWPVAFAIAGAALGLWATSVWPATLLTAALAGALAEAAYLLGIWIVDRQPLSETLVFARRGFRAAVAGS